MAPDVAKHAAFVARISGQIARTLDMTPDEVNDIKAAARWHDIGKLAVDEAILRKPGSFTSGEYAEMKMHAEVGVEMLGDGFPPEFSEVVVYHHERYDGYGYYGLKGEEIPFAARIVAIADVVEALTAHDRPYKNPMPEAEALALMTADVSSPGFGRRAFDPYIMRQYVSMRLADPEFSASAEQRESLAAYARTNPMSDLSPNLMDNDGWVVKASGERLNYSFTDNGGKRLEAIVGRTGAETFRRENPSNEVEAPSLGL